MLHAAGTIDLSRLPIKRGTPSDAKIVRLDARKFVSVQRTSRRQPVLGRSAIAMTRSISLTPRRSCMRDMVSGAT